MKSLICHTVNQIFLLILVPLHSLVNLRQRHNHITLLLICFLLFSFNYLAFLIFTFTMIIITLCSSIYNMNDALADIRQTVECIHIKSFNPCYVTTCRVLKMWNVNNNINHNFSMFLVQKYKKLK